MKAKPSSTPVESGRMRRQIDDIIAPTTPHKTKLAVQTVAKPAQKSVAVTVTATKPAATPPTTSKAPAQTRSANHARRHQPQRAATLVRRSVKKPSPSLKKQVQVQHQATAPAAHTVVAVKKQASHVDHVRLQRAETIPKNPQVNRFYNPQPVQPTFAAIPVQQAPQHHAANQAPAAPPPVPLKAAADMFEQAIAGANHYVDLALGKKQQFKKRARRHALSMSAGIVAVLLITAFALYQNSPGAQIKLAGMRAGVATAAPNFVASGFAYSGVTQHDSRLIYGLKNDRGNYHLSEQTTNWDGDSMIQHVSSVSASGKPNYRGVKVGDHTVYRFDDRQATWVKDGVWYQLSGTAPLSDTELHALVTNS